MSVRRAAVAMLALAGLAVALVGLVAREATADPSVSAPRFSVRGWVGVTQTGAPVLACPDPACTAPALVDVDSDPTTADSSRATLTVPAGATVAWTGLDWSGDLGVNGECAGAATSPSSPGTQPATSTPPASPSPSPGASGSSSPSSSPTPASASPHHVDIGLERPAKGRSVAPTMVSTQTLSASRAGQVEVSVGDQPYLTITATSTTSLVGPAGTAGYHAYADITSLIRPFGGRSTATTLSLTVGGVEAASGPGCVGGWVVTLVYSFPNGPDGTFAPRLSTLSVYSASLSTAGGTNPVDLTRPPAPSGSSASSVSAPAGGLLATALLASRPGLVVSLNGVAAGVGAGSAPTLGFSTGTVLLGDLGPRLTLGASGPSGFVAAVVALATDLAAPDALSMSASFNPPAAAVGSVVALTLSVTNSADLPDPNVSVSVALPMGLSLAQPDPSFDPASGVWMVGTLAGHATATLTLEVRVGLPGQYATAARVALPQAGAGVVADLVAESVSSDAPVGTLGQAAGGRGAGPAPIAPGILIGVGLFALGLVLLLLVALRRRVV
jgi:uncharacterized repeat protein (TIGR01451 family)